MSRRKVQFFQGEYYHIYNRGCNKENIFLEKENYEYLLRQVKRKSMLFNVTIIAYCLMPNHFHFLLRQDGPISLSEFIQSVFNCYTKAFNKQYERSGTLFEERFKAIHIRKQNYLIHLCRYIHRNPLEAGLVHVLEDWKYSNYLEWVGKRNGRLVDSKFVHDNFPVFTEYVKYVHEYVLKKKFQQELDKYLIDWRE